MHKLDILIYVAHLVVWMAFGLMRVAAKRADSATAQTVRSAQATDKEEIAPYSRTAVGLHSLAFGVMYFGLGSAAFQDQFPDWFPGHRIVGACIIAAGGALACWAVSAFRSWRFRAALDQGHVLATKGPFRFVRHPIYLGLNLLALGTAVWVPTGIQWASVILMFLGSEIRARTEERLLIRVFGAAYEDYRSRTRRFIPGIY